MTRTRKEERGRAPVPDAAAAAVLALIPAEDPDTPIDLDAARAGYEMLAALGGGQDVPADGLGVSDGTVGGVRVRTYRPTGATTPAPALVYFHGGGYTIGSLDTHDPQCRQLAHLSGLVVVSVDYRLAPEHRFPAAFDDAEAVLVALLQDGADLGIDGRRVGVCGSSAGGTLAAACAQRLRGRLRFQGLLYPSTDLRGAWPSYEENATGYLLTTRRMRWFREQTAPDPSVWTDPRVSPLLGDAAGTPPAWILTCGFDPLRDEGVAYAHALVDAGVAVTHVHAEDQIHECVQLAGAIPAGARLLGELAEAAAHALVATP